MAASNLSPTSGAAKPANRPKAMTEPAPKAMVPDRLLFPASAREVPYLLVKRPPKQVSTNKAEPPGTLAGAIKSATITADMTISNGPLQGPRQSRLRPEAYLEFGQLAPDDIQTWWGLA